MNLMDYVVNGELTIPKVNADLEEQDKNKPEGTLMWGITRYILRSVWNKDDLNM